MSLRFPLLALGVLALAASGLAQDWKGMGRLEGRVLDEKGDPIAGATVSLELPERGGGTTLTTDAKGKWAVGGIAAGTWHLDIEAEGYVTRRASVELPSESTRLRPLEVRLEKAAPQGPPPEVVEALEKAEAAYKEGRFKEARAEYDRLLALRPDLSATIHQQIGFSYIQQKQYAEALGHLEKALETEPQNNQIRAITAQTALEAGRLEEGRQILATLDDSAITNPDLFYNIGVGFLNAGAAEEAIQSFSKAIILDASYVDGYYRRALAYLQLGRSEESKADFRKVVELAPDSPMGELSKKALGQLE